MIKRISQWCDNCDTYKEHEIHLKSAIESISYGNNVYMECVGCPANTIADDKSINVILASAILRINKDIL